jgi:hypothetical protein
MAGNISGNAYALTVLSPIKNDHTKDGMAYADIVRDRLQGWNTEDNSPMALVPHTYLCRYFVLDDVCTESLPGADLRNLLSDLRTIISDSARRNALPKEDHLKSRYLVFSSNLYCGPTGNCDDYLRGMWNAISDRIKEIWGYCYGFEHVHNADSFVAYMKKCQVTTSLFFVGSSDDSLEEQLKALYLKQQLIKFALDNQSCDAPTVREHFRTFIQRVAPANLAAPTWPAGQYRLPEK